MAAAELFELLDLDGDGLLTRRELGEAARRLGWHWREAPFYAVMDHLTVLEPISREEFLSCVAQIRTDPSGPYGAVLQRSPLCSAWAGERSRSAPPAAAPVPERRAEREASSPGLVALLGRLLGRQAAEGYAELLGELCVPPQELGAAKAALLLIDPQRSFTSGVWKRSIGPAGDGEVAPLALAFANCAARLSSASRGGEMMFTRCPFPPDSYQWDERVAPHVAEDQLYFVKPGNSALWPPTNGCRDWLCSLPGRGVESLVIGGCTLNSCVRVSAIEIQALLAGPVQVVVDLALCGARTSNYAPSVQFGGRSSVEAAVREMVAAGVRVVSREPLP